MYPYFDLFKSARFFFFRNASLRCKKAARRFGGLPSYLLFQRLFERFQMCIFSASAISCSRKSGCAIEISASARYQLDLPLRLIMPYSVTTYWVAERGSVTIEPSDRVGRMRDAIVPSFCLKVEDRQIKLLPPFDR